MFRVDLLLFVGGLFILMSFNVDLSSLSPDPMFSCIRSLPYVIREYLSEDTALRENASLTEKEIHFEILFRLEASFLVDKIWFVLVLKSSFCSH